MMSIGKITALAWVPPNVLVTVNQLDDFAAIGPPQEPDLRCRLITVTADGLRALSKSRPIMPASVERYLAGKFGDGLDSATAAMRALAKSMPPRELSKAAYGLYERFRPEIPPGVRGWGAVGELNLDRLKSLAVKRR